jgi:UMF1 family MFS transporter
MSQNPEIKKNDKKTINAWAMYDWSNSVYSLVIASAIFPAYYNQVTRIDGSSKILLFGLQLENTAVYSICLGLSFGIIALLSPMLSSISDYSGNHKSFMRFFCYLGSLACMMLFFFTGQNLIIGLLSLMLATVGYAGSIVFYNAYLPSIATEERQDKVSARGYAFGYIGSTLLLLFNLTAILNQDALGIADDTILPRLSFLLTGIWWFGFSHITFAKLPKGIYRKMPRGNYLLNGYKELIKVWHYLRNRRVLRIYLLAFFFYIMSVQTVMFMAASFGEKEIKMNTANLILTILIVELVGIAGAFLFARLSTRFSNFKALLIAICIWIGVCVGALFIQLPWHFYIAGFFIGMVMGGIQSLSRSTFSKLIPKTGNNAGFFSFYDVCEKVAMMSGLIMFGYLDNLTGSMRNSIIALGIGFIIGFIQLWRIRKYSPGLESPEIAHSAV